MGRRWCTRRRTSLILASATEATRRIRRTPPHKIELLRRLSSKTRSRQARPLRLLLPQRLLQTSLQAPQRPMLLPPRKLLLPRLARLCPAQRRLRKPST